MKPRTISVSLHNVNQPIGVFAHRPEQYRTDGWYDCGSRGRWFFRRRDPVVVLDAWGKNPVLCHVSFINLSGWIMCENKFNGFAYPAIPPGADRVYPTDMFHPLNALYAELP